MIQLPDNLSYDEGGYIPIHKLEALCLQSDLLRFSLEFSFS